MDGNNLLSYYMKFEFISGIYPNHNDDEWQVASE
ncbi:hypothetical protein JOD29_002575 [Lysinibacillus composti]|nr:hypothetical protein [Lysinibacillus composti]